MGGIGFDQLGLALLGTLVCLFGFLSRPRSGYELLRPHFVIPGIIWISTFWHAMSYWAIGPVYDVLNQDAYRATFGVQAQLFIILCLLCFWVGYALPLGYRIGGWVSPLYYGFSLHSGKFRPMGLAIAVGVFLLLLAMGGPAALNASWNLGGFVDVPFLRAGNLGIVIYVLIVLGAGLIGIGWPLKARHDPIGVAVSILGLLMLSAPFMANFSRGTGLAFVVALAAYCLRHRRLPVMGTIIVVVWVLLCGHAGLTGRGIYGHRGGVLPYLWHLLTYSTLAGFDIFRVGTSAGDAYTVTSTVMAGVATTDLHALGPFEWLFFQIPVPRIFGLHREWTVDVTLFLGGTGAWNYTTSIFGDVFIHYRWFGALPFVFVGVMYRMVDFLAFRLTAAAPHLLNPFVLFLATSYLAMFMGIFNSFRAWNVAFFYPLYLLAICLVLVKAFAPPAYPVNLQRG